MKGSLLFAAFIVMMYNVAAAQKERMLIKKSGTTILYAKQKQYEDQVEIHTLDGKKQLIPLSDILGFCNPNTGELEYQLAPHLYSMTRILEGEINVYKGFQAGAPVYTAYGVKPGARHKVHYAEKRGELFLFVNGKEKGRKFLDALIADAPKPITMPADDFSFNDAGLMDILRAYNLQFFKGIPPSSYRKTSTFQFYSSATTELILSLNDSLTYTFKTSQSYPLSIYIPADVLSKVCVNSDNHTYCDLFAPSKCGMRFFEIKFNEKRHYFDISSRTKEEMQNRLIDMRK